jgi:hypothetical protein
MLWFTLKNREREKKERARQKKLDRQGNTARRLSNSLYKLTESLKLKNMKVERVSGFGVNGEYPIEQISMIWNEPHLPYGDQVVVRIWVDMFDSEQTRWDTNIRLTLGARYTFEVWEQGDEALLALEKRLKDYLSERFCKTR